MSISSLHGFCRLLNFDLKHNWDLGSQSVPIGTVYVLTNLD